MHGCFYLTCHPIHAFANSLTNRSYNHKHYPSQHSCSCKQSNTIEKNDLDNSDNDDDTNDVLLNDFNSDDDDEFSISDAAPLPLSQNMSTLEVKFDFF